MSEHNPPMMKCGHAANATDGKTGAPCCVICHGLPGATQVDDTPPDLSQRMARCAYYGKNVIRPFHGSCDYGGQRGTFCYCEKPSSAKLPFFEHVPSKEFDRFYCGCMGWD